MNHASNIPISIWKTQISYYESISRLVSACEPSGSMKVTMSSTCPQCGAKLAPGETCQDRFNICLVKEFDLAACGAVHHLTVPSYLLQHNAYSREGWLDAREGLAQFIQHGLAPAEARRKNRARLDSGHRSWSLTKGPKLPGIENIRWTITIADIRLDTAENYCADVRRWAESILADSEALVRLSRNAV